MHYKRGSYAALTKLGLSTGMQRVLMPAAIAGLASGGVGAYNNEDDRLGGALRGAAGGALLGGTAGLLHNGIANLTDEALIPINRNIQNKGVTVTPRPAELLRAQAPVTPEAPFRMADGLDWQSLLAAKKKRDLN